VVERARVPVLRCISGRAQNVGRKGTAFFCVKNGKTGAGPFEMLKTAFGDERLSCARTFEWFKRVKEGRNSIDDNPRSGQPSTSRNYDFVVRVRELIHENRRLTVREIFAEVGTFMVSAKSF
jgi:hypothetical protein